MPLKRIGARSSSLSITPALLQDLDDLASKTQRSRSQTVRLLLQEALAARANQRPSAKRRSPT